MMNGQWIEIFRAGNHRSRGGTIVSYSVQDLAKIVNLYNASEHTAPIVIGHPRHNSPAYGWVKALKIEGDRLLAQMGQVAPEFAQAIAEGRYKKRSISLYPDGALRHVGFLGGMPPAVKGLKDIQFSEEPEELVYEFNEMEEEMDTEALKKVLAEKESLLAEKESMIEQMQQQLNALNQTLEEQKRTKVKADIEEFCEQLLDEGRLTPAQKEPVLQLLGYLDGGEEFCEFGEFGEGDRPGEVLRALLKQMPVQVEFGESGLIRQKQKNTKSPRGLSEYSESDVDEDRLEIHEKALHLVKEQNIDYATAVTHILKGDN